MKDPTSVIALHPEAPSRRTIFGRDLMASIVVCLVALPLCMGIAIASGVPPALGLVTGIIGGIVVGTIAGSPLQVSGPAAGLAVLVWQLVQTYGIAGMGIAVAIAGAIQLAAGALKLGRWFRAVSPAVIQGMLAGIGALILLSQIHVTVDDKPRGSGIANLSVLPEAFVKGFDPSTGVHFYAAMIGLGTILTIVLWNKFRPRALRMLPGALVGVIVATAAASILTLPIARVVVPANLASTFTWLGSGSLDLFGNVAFWGSAIGLALVASAETLLCATAVDRMHDGTRTNYDKELRAQGIGNLLCGAVGALPMTGVIVRSSANVEAGAITRTSAILHGVWILVLVVLLPSVLAAIPTASLAAVLVFTGVKLINVQTAKKLYEKGWTELAIWAITLVAIVATDLLTGVAIGFGCALLRLLSVFLRIDVAVSNKDGRDGRYDVHVRGAATFMTLPKLAAAIENIPSTAREVHFHVDKLAYIDHACMELIEDWRKRHPSEIFIEHDHLTARSSDRVLLAA
jgi:MFS superfamily sulfate permease-like transporter